MLLWTIIVLAIAVHFNGVLVTNDLSECLSLGFGVGFIRDVKLTCPLARFVPFAIFVSAATIVLLLALSVLFHFQICSIPGILNRVFPDCSLVSRKPTLSRQESNLGASALTVSFGWVRSPPGPHPFSSNVTTDRFASFSPCRLFGHVGC